MLIVRRIKKDRQAKKLQPTCYRKGDSVTFSYVDENGKKFPRCSGEVNRVFEPGIYEVISYGSTTVITDYSHRISKA